MNVRFLAAFLCLATLSGCIIHDHDDGPCCGNPPPSGHLRSGDVTFLWTLQGQRCADQPQVKGVNIRIPGERLANSGRYACSTGGVDGITLHDFQPGTYNYELEAVSYQNEVLYTAIGTFIVNGDVRVTVDLMPYGSPSSYATLSWSFPNNMSCYKAGVRDVEIIIDNSLDLRALVACEDGTGGRYIETPALEPGEHSIKLFGLDSSGRVLFQNISGFTTRANAPNDHHFTLNPVGRLALSWTFSNNDAASVIGCAETGVQELSIDFQDSTGRWVYNGDGVVVSCYPTGRMFDLAPGHYRISIFGTGFGGVLYRSSDYLSVDVVQGQERGVTAMLMGDLN